MILARTIMLVLLLITRMILAVDFALRGANSVWISSNVRPLGCYSPFDPRLKTFDSFTNNPDKMEFSSCNYCGLSDFVLVRGAQCFCIHNSDVANLVPVSDTYCNIPCNEDPYYDGNEVLKCGGNLGISLYCNKQSGSNCLNANSNGTFLDIYEDFGSDRIADFKTMEPCLTLGCGGLPSYLDPSNLVYNEYFPNLNPEDCIVYCSFEKTSYAHAGWITQQKDVGTYLYPTCACSNITIPADPKGLPCTNGTCPSILDSYDDSFSCGNKQAENENWSIYCTTIVFESEENGTTSCAPYQTIPLSSDLFWETCSASPTSTEGVKSSVIITVTPEEKCFLLQETKGVILPRDGNGMQFVCRNDCTDLNCCQCGNCGNVTSCSFNGSCYDISSDSSNSNTGSVELWRSNLADKCNKEHPGGHLVAIETQPEQEFLAYVLSEASDVKSPVLSSGVMNSSNESFWDLSNSYKIQIPSDVSNWGVKISIHECTSFPCYLMLTFQDGETPGYYGWQFSRCAESFYFVCEYDEPKPQTTTVTSTTSTIPSTTTSVATTSSSTRETTTDSVLTSSTTTKTTSTTRPPTTLKPDIPYDNCPCSARDMYNVKWIINANETKYQSCRQGAAGNASWTCDLIANYGCRLRTPQPDFTNCQSLELVEITGDVQSASNETDLYAVWETLRDFTSPVSSYFGHEIDNILDIIIDLLDQQDGQMNGTKNRLGFQLNTTQSGARIIDNLISHSAQWEQLTSPDDRSQKALLLLNVSEDMSFRLTDIAEEDNRSLRCEINLANVTLSSAYWNGNQTRVDDCDLDSDSDTDDPTDNDNIAESELFRRFPMSDVTDGSTYLLLPEGTIENHRTHKAAGLLISHYILEQLFPGHNNKEKYDKKVNGPLISYTLRKYDSNNRHLIDDQIPKDSFVELVYQHGELAKDPPVRILRRSLNPGETPSAVIGSSFCAFLSFNESGHVGNETTNWVWDGFGCNLKSTNRTHTVCKCNHLTGFASLMDFHDYTGESRPLEITSIVCSLASAISLAITFIVLTALRSIRTDRTVITQNLCIFLMLSHVMALTTLNRHYLHLDQATCAAMGILLHFCLLVSFMWMGIEGLRLCRMVLYVFNLRDWTLYYVLAAYIIPIIIVGVTVLTAQSTTTIISAYTGDETCWLNGANYKWSFAGPVAVIILVNLVFAIIAVRSSWNLKQNTDRSLEEKVRNAAALLLSLTCLLGISWLTGFLLYAETQVFAYIFTITNGLQGVTIMLFRCLLNDEVRTAIKERWRRHRNNRIGRWSSTMTTNTSSQRRQSHNTDADGKLKSNMKLSQTNSQSSVLSSATKTTDASFISSNSQHPSDRRQRNIRTFSGTEFSDEFCSEISDSFSNASSASYRHRPAKREQSNNNDGVRDSRRVSFFIQQNSTPVSSFQSGIHEHISSGDNSSETLVSRRSGNQLFYEQDASAFF